MLTKQIVFEQGSAMLSETARGPRFSASTQRHHRHVDDSLSGFALDQSRKRVRVALHELGRSQGGRATGLVARRQSRPPPIRRAPPIGGMSEPTTC